MKPAGIKIVCAGIGNCLQVNSIVLQQAYHPLYNGSMILGQIRLFPEYRPSDISATMYLCFDDAPRRWSEAKAPMRLHVSNALIGCR